MATNLFKAVMLVVVAQLFLFGNCNKNTTTPCVNGGYNFAVTSEWSPQKLTYKVGDTIYLTSMVSKILTDQNNTSVTINYSNSTNIGGDIVINLVDSVKMQNSPARDSFGTVVVNGSFAEREFNKPAGINFLYKENPNDYGFKGGFVCNKKGTYAISVSDLHSNGLRGKNCTNANFGMTVTNSEKNLQLYERLLGIMLDAYAIKRGYCFRVQ